MRTLVVSDLHLGTRGGSDLLRRAELREPLCAALADVDRLVILGDGLELREVPARRAGEVASDALADFGRALGAGKEIVMLGGNHDHALTGAWIEAELGQADRRLGLEQRFGAGEAGALARALAQAAGPARLTFAYPGIWLRDDVYALHGHYLDLHTTVPTIERLLAGAMQRFVTPVPERATPDHYEAALAPLYAWMYALAQRSNEGVIRAGSRSSARAWVALAGAGRNRAPVRAALLGAGFYGVVQAINAAGIGPVRPHLSGEALRQGSLHGIGEVVRRLGIDARHVVFGHSHRSGPWPDDIAAEWRAPTGAQLLNTGSWVYQPHFVAGAPANSPYWPGTAVLVDDDGPPELRRLLADRSHAQLRPVRPA